MDSLGQYPSTEAALLHQYQRCCQRYESKAKQDYERAERQIIFRGARSHNAKYRTLNDGRWHVQLVPNQGTAKIKLGHKGFKTGQYQHGYWPK
jgi:hypothetical protein